jgi:hypothetical protein
MADNKQNTGKADDIRVDINDKNEVEYLHQQFPDRSHKEIAEAIRTAGPLRTAIVRQLENSKGNKN